MLTNVFAIVLPVFLLIAIGYGTARARLLPETAGDALGQFVYVIAIPVLIFKTLAEVDLGGQTPWGLWAAYFTGIACAWTLGTLIIRKGFGREARAGVIGGISAGFANTVMVGLPLVDQVYGERGLVALMVIISIHLPVMTMVTAVLMERAATLDGISGPVQLSTLLAKVGRSLLTNPLAIAIASSVAWRMTGIPITGIFEDILDRIAGTALPVALLSLGMSMVMYGVRGNLLPGLCLSLVKVLVMPLVVFIMSAYVVQLPPLWVCAATLTAACPTGVNAYIFANRYGTGHAMSTNAITVTTMAAVFTCAAWVYFLDLWRAGV
ncbi:transporter [Roseibium aquae]|uniref:Transporter n=1 Tax=Roseibium aquae TaxID=1323746 RepID=A0A916TD70_9HYPH|nr:AEC family transporter [Roseibium aquae]GGB38899.1 transporter [Roseibium aquae]